MKQSSHRLAQSVQCILLICLVAGSTVGAWGCVLESALSPAPAATVALPAATVTASSIPAVTVAPFFTPTATVRPNEDECAVILRPGSVRFDGSDVPPGTVICLDSGDYEEIVCENLQGVVERPITIRNYGGRVRVVNGELALRNCRHVRLTGAGTPGLEYGIHADRAWVHVYEKPRGIEIDHIEVSDQRLSVGDRADPDHETTDIHIHHNYLHCSPGGYGDTVMYIGRAQYDQHPGQYIMRRVEIHHNTFDGADGRALKVTSIVEDCRVHHNLINDVLRKPVRTLKEAVAIAQGCTVRFFSNTIQECPGYGISVGDPFFPHYVYNNLIVNTGQGNEYQDALIIWHGNSHVFNNTIIAARRHGIAFPGQASDNYAFNNIVLDTGDVPIRQGGSPDQNLHHNLTKDDGYTTANFGFVDPANGDYHLTEGCPAVDAGITPSFQLTFDLDDALRPIGEYDVGAFEFK